MANLTETPGVKMLYLIKRRSTTSREELVAHWFKNHMPAVIEGQGAQQTAGKRHATRYIATLFDADASGAHVWDGVAQLWWDEALNMPDVPHGSIPTDTFQEKAQPYVPWATKEYVVLDGALPVQPLTLHEPFPSTRSGFLKVTFLVSAKRDTDYGAFFKHWLDVHVPNVSGVMREVGGTRYCVSHSLDPSNEPYAGIAELYFDDADAWSEYQRLIQPDGMEQWVDPDNMAILRAQTEMIGIP